MRFRRALLALLSILVAAGVASAQTPPPKKKKKPKKPKVTQPVQVDPDDDDDADAGPPEPDPPKINTDLKETDSATPSGPNPWAASGLVKKRGEDASTPPPSSSSAPRPDAMPARGAISAEAFGGYASANLRVGFGVRGGYTLDNGLYLGGAFTYHLGTRFGSTTETFFYPAFELGYDYRALPEVTLRPYAGLGLGVEHVSDSSNILSQAQTDASFTFYPGVQLDYELPRSPVYLGLDMRVVVAAGDNAPDASFGFFVLAGGRF